MSSRGVDDETYSRTLLVADPDGGTQIWVNDRPTDLDGDTDLSAG